MAEFPLLVRFRTDDYPTLVPVDSEDTVSEAAEKISHVVDSRVHIDHDRPLSMIYAGEVLANDALISDVVEPVEYVELQYEGEEIPEGFGKSHPAWTGESMLEAHPEHAKPQE
ncbi:toluene-4-monooxygenase system B family protein [Halobellus litoreus]|uniref:Toluene-4-monooxygenase system B family protein n=1 Tax=Halobellus litoreus TaxID=755310 RepID=A0ABD6DUD8_9EURY|nr:toluene-4-monooxygenase system B family protein [Halobellus litoreus]